MIIKTLISRTVLAGILVSLYACGGGGGGGDSKGPINQTSSNVATAPSSSSASVDDTSSSTSTGVSVSSVSQAEVSSSSSSGVSSSTGDVNTPIGDAVAGKALYAKDCAVCHGTDVKGGSNPLDVNKSLYSYTGSSDKYSMVEYIKRYMPVPNLGLCNDTCAKNIAAYLNTLKTTQVVTSSSVSSAQNPVVSSSSAATVVSSSSIKSVASSSFSSLVSSASSSSVSSKSSQSSALSSSSSISSSSSSKASSVSSVASSVSSASSSSSAAGDAVRGRQLYEGADLGCVTCHKADGSGLLASMKLDLSKTQFTAPGSTVQYSLAQYIDLYMPTGATDKCDATCANDIAAYLRSWSASSSVSSSSVSSAAVSSSSATVSSSSSSSAGAIPVGNAQTGEALFNSYACSGCHGVKGSGGANGAIDPNKATYKYMTKAPEPLRPFLINQMLPQLGLSSCGEQCVSDLIAYIKTFGADGTPVADNKDPYADWTPPADGSCGVTYGPRSLRLLTRLEFANSIEDLTGVNIQRDLGSATYDALPADVLVAGFSNNVMATIEPGALQAYDFVANKVIDKVIENNYAGVVSCTANTSVEECGAKLIEQFMPRIFRRNVTDSEIEQYSILFSSEYSGGNLADGMRLALRTMMTSPNFLYRDETGVLVSELGKTPDEPKYDMVGEPNVVFATETDPGYHAGKNVNFAAGINIIEITAKAAGKDASGAWPVLNIDAGNNKYTLSVTTTYSKIYRIVTPAFSSATGGYAGFASSRGPGFITMSSVRIYGAKVAEVQAPKVELDSDAYVLTPDQLASYLSYTFTGTTPDAELLRAANEGGLDTNEQIEAQVARLLKTARAKQHFGNYAAQWLRADRVLDRTKSPTDFPGFTEDVRKAMAQEVRDMFNYVIVDGAAPYTDLFNGKYTFANQALANFYGISGVSGSEMRKVATTNRAGLVTSGAFMTVNAHEKDTAPILRAVNLRKAFLCHDVPAPPTGISLNGENVDAAREESIRLWEEYLAQNGGKAPARKKYEHQTSAALCQTCHKEMINPLGGGMEDFDAVGRLQTVDYNGFTVDFSGEMFGLNSVNEASYFAFSGAVDLANQISGSDAARACLIDNSFRLAMGTGATYFDREKSIWLDYDEKDSYSCNAKTLDTKLRTQGSVAMLKALGSLDSVRYRKNVTR